MLRSSFRMTAGFPLVQSIIRGGWALISPFRMPNIVFTSFFQRKTTIGFRMSFWFTVVFSDTQVSICQDSTFCQALCGYGDQYTIVSIGSVQFFYQYSNYISILELERFSGKWPKLLVALDSGRVGQGSVGSRVLVSAGALRISSLHWQTHWNQVLTICFHVLSLNFYWYHPPNLPLDTQHLTPPLTMEWYWIWHD